VQKCFEMKNGNERVGPRTKEQYRSPTVTRVTQGQAVRLVMDRTSRSDQEAKNVLQSLREELCEMAKQDKKAS
jgi:hypothetical protein